MFAPFKIQQIVPELCITGPHLPTVNTGKQYKTQAQSNLCLNFLSFAHLHRLYNLHKILVGQLVVVLRAVLSPLSIVHGIGHVLNAAKAKYTVDELAAAQYYTVRVQNAQHMRFLR